MAEHTTQRLAEEFPGEESVRVRYARNLRSYWNTAQFNDFGGVLWLTLLCSLGFINAEIVTFVSRVVEKRIREAGRQPSEGPLTGPRQSKRAQAATLGNDLPPVMGIQHKMSEAKKQREAAKLAVKRAKKIYIEWRG